MVPVDMPSAEMLRVCFSYDPETGDLTWKTRPPDHFPDAKVAHWWNTRFAGKPALHSVWNGRYRIGALTLHGARHSLVAHRVIFKMVTGREPIGVDHKNNVKSDNRWENLREAPQAQNNYNKPRTRAHLPKGVFLMESGRYRAVISADRVRYHLGRFDTPEAAHAAYCAKAAELHGDFHNPGVSTHSIFG